MPYLLGMEHPRKYHGANRGNLGNAENANSKDTCIYMLVSSHSSVLNLLNSSACRFAPNQTPTLSRMAGQCEDSPADIDRFMVMKYSTHVLQFRRGGYSCFKYIKK